MHEDYPQRKITKYNRSCVYTEYTVVSNDDYSLLTWIESCKRTGSDPAVFMHLS